MRAIPWDGTSRAYESAKQFQAGRTVITIVTAGTPVTNNIVFATPFDVAPIITVSAARNDPQFFSVAFSLATTTGFSVTLNRTTGTGAVEVDWQAMAPTQ